MQAPKYRPLDKIEFARALGMKGDQRGMLKQALGNLERSGEIARIRKNRYVLPAEADLVTGKLQVHQAGFAFLVRENSDEGDIFVAAENTGTAMNGDRVVARITRDAAYSRARSASNRPEGRVIRILERAHETMVGTLQQTRNFHYVVPDDPRIVHDVYVQPLPLAGATRAPLPGDKVVVRLEPWESRHVNPEGEIIELLGRASDPGVDMLSIIRKHHLPTEFPDEVLAEAERVPETVDPDAYGEREDLREKFIVIG
jgi:ribonuclease R